MDLYLLRAALVQIGQSEEGLGLRARLGDVTIYSTQSARIDQKLAGTIFVASSRVVTNIDLKSGEPITIPDEPRRKAEAALETTARLMAIDQQATHSLASPMPFIGFTCDDPAILVQLDGRIVLQRTMLAHQGATTNLGLFSDIDPQVLSDRLDGVALLAEALNTVAPLGRYLQLMRLFERAFRLGPGALTDPLANLLRPSPFNIDEAEVRSWTDARAASAHADRREEFYLGSDVRPIVDRMLQAGYEVLMNKKLWRHASSDRRESWRPVAGSQGTGSDIFVTQRKEAKLNFQFLDGFDSYPLVLAGPFDSILPRAAWVVADDDGSRLRVKGEWASVQS
jgi:hypothetical protein